MSAASEGAFVPLQLCSVTGEWDAVFSVRDGGRRCTKIEPVAVWVLCRLDRGDAPARTKVVGLIQTAAELEAPEFIDVPMGSVFLGYRPRNRSMSAFMATVDSTGEFK